MRGTAADVLTPTGAVVAATANIDDAEQRFVTLGVSELYVLEPDGQLAGVLPDYDLLKRRIAGEHRPQSVADLMSRIEVRASCTTPLRELAVHLRQGCHARIPVVAKGRLIGEVTRSSMLRHLRTTEAVNVPGAPGAGAPLETRQAPLPAPKFLRGDLVPSQLAAAPLMSGIAITS